MPKLRKPRQFFEERTVEDEKTELKFLCEENIMISKMISQI